MRSVRIPATFAISAFIVVSACASPILSVGNGTPMSWTTAINSGYVAPVSAPLAGPSVAFYQQEVASEGLAGFEQEVPTLTPDVPITVGSSTEKSLVMSWNQPAVPNTLGVAEWSWNYPADPDFTTALFKIQLMPPVGIQDIGFIFVDNHGNGEGWYFDIPPTADAFPIYNIVADDPNPQGPLQFFYKDPGFDITHVMSIRLDESSLSGVSFPEPDPTGNGAAWNAWGTMNVVPEPTSFLSLLFGVSGLLIVGRPRRG